MSAPDGAPADAVLDRVARLAGQLLGGTAAVVTVLEDEVSRTVAATPGLVPAAVVEALCRRTAGGRGPLVVDDATGAGGAAGHQDRDQDQDGDEGVGAFLGVPLLTPDGRVAGALGVLAPTAREWTQEESGLLADLAAAAVGGLELSALAVRYEAERLRWQLSISAGGVGSFDWNLQTGRLVWDDRLVEMFGYDREGFTESIEAFDARLHPDDLPRVTAALQQAVAECGEFEAEYRVVLPGGRTRWIQARGTTVPDEQGRAAHLLGAAYDTTTSHEADVRIARVLETMSTAFFSLDPQWRFSYVNAEAERVLQRSRTELLGEVVWEVFPSAIGSDFEVNYRGAARQGTATSFEAYYPPPLDAWYEVRAWPGVDGLSVYFLDITARRAAQEQAESARAALQAALEEAEASSARLRLLTRVGEDLTATLDVETAVGRLAGHLVPALGDWCIVSLVDDSGALQDVGAAHADPGRLPLLQRYVAERMKALDPRASFAATAVATRRTALVPAPAHEAIAALLSTEEARTCIRALAPETAAAIPLRARGRTTGLITLCRAAGRPPLAGDDLAAAEEIAERAALALDNARLFTRQQRVAEGLQRHLLTAPVEPDHSQVVVRYQPAAEAAQVGGDWYDAFMQPDGATVLVIGDVMGHDVEAAAAMSQVRSLLRGIAYATGGTPSQVLSGLDAAMQGLQVETTATAIVARVEQSPDELGRDVTRLRWSNAGHLPPMLITPDGTVTPLAGVGHDLLLGIDPSFPRLDSAVAVDRGSTVVLYTDGLVERRDEALEDSIATLRTVIADLAAEPLDELVDGVLARMVPGRHEDDVALVAVRLHPHDAPRPPEAGPERIPVTPPVD